MYGIRIPGQALGEYCFSSPWDGALSFQPRQQQNAQIAAVKRRTIRWQPAGRFLSCLINLCAALQKHARRLLRYLEELEDRAVVKGITNPPVGSLDMFATPSESRTRPWVLDSIYFSKVTECLRR